MSLLPHTKIGQWRFYLSVAFAILFVLKTTSLPIPVPSPVIFAIGIAGLVLTVIALIKRDRAWLQLVIALPIGAFVIFWVGGELLFPH